MADSQSITLLKRFCDCTSAHGFHKIFQSANSLHRIIWLLIITAAVAGFSIHFVSLISRFYQSPVNTETRVYSTKFTFPDVTLCSTSHVSRIRFDNDPMVPGENATVKQLIQRIRKFWGPAGDNDSSEINGDLRNSLKSYLYNINITKQAQDLMLHCHYAGSDCSFLDFVEYVDPQYFSCYTFKPRNRHLIVGGENDGGLMIVLYAGDGANFITEEESLSFSQGFRVVIHEQGTRPNMMEGFYIQQATNTYAQLSYTVETVLSKKSRQCTEDSLLPEIEFIDRNNQLRSYKYSLTDCTMHNYQQHLNRTCKCLSEMLPLPKVFMQQAGDLRDRFCHRIDTQSENGSAEARARQECHDKALETMHRLTAEGKFGCSLSCSNLQYDMRLTQNAWPSDSGEAKRALLKSVKRTASKAEQANLDLSVLKQIKQLLRNDSSVMGNFLKLNVYSHSIMGNMVVESWAYPARNLFSDIGGILGLWLGVSIISTFEFIELFIGLIRTWSIAERTSCKHTKQQQQQNRCNEAELQQLRDNNQRQTV